MDLYGQQLHWLSEKGIAIGEDEEASVKKTKYKDLSKAFRAMLDYAMRTRILCMETVNSPMLSHLLVTIKLECGGLSLLPPFSHPRVLSRSFAVQR